jgi:predicted NUDIX family phosphoesterase
VSTAAATPAVESVLCVPRAAFEAAPLAGFARDDAPFGPPPAWLHEATARPRTAELEADESWLQLAAYTILRHGRSVLVYRRPGGADARLAGKWSLGVGGHVTAADLEAVSRGRFGGYACRGAAFEAAHRELREELEPPLPASPDPLSPFDQDALGLARVGYLHDPSDHVGRCHLGVVFQAYLAEPGVRFRAGEAADAGWARCRDLSALDGPWESWSGLLRAELAAGRLG